MVLVKILLKYITEYILHFIPYPNIQEDVDF